MVADRVATTTIRLDGTGATRGAAEFERAAARVKKVNAELEAANLRADRTADHAAKAAERRAKAEATLATARARAAQIAATGTATAEKLARAEEVVARAQERVRKATEATTAAEQRSTKAKQAQADAAKRVAEVGDGLNYNVSVGDEAAKLDKLRQALDPAAEASAKLAQSTEFLDRQLARGKIDVLEHGRLIGLLKDKYGDTADEGHRLGESAGATAMRMRNLSYQFSDTVASLGSGAGPMQVLIQQGPQVADAFGGIPTLLGKIPTSARLAAAGLLAIGVAAALVGARMAEIASQQRRIEVIGKTLNPTFAGMAKQLREVTEATKQAGASSQEAFGATSALQTIRGMTGGVLKELAPLSVDVAAVLGKTVPDAAKLLGEGFVRGAAGVRELNKELHFLGPEDLKEVARLEKQGRTADIVALALNKLTAIYQGKSKEMESSWGRAMESIGNAWDRMLERIGNDEGLTAAGRKVGSLFDWFTETFNPDLTKPAADEIARVTAELEAARKVAVQLSQMGDTGTGMVGDPAGEAVQRVLDLEDRLRRLKERTAAAAPPATTEPDLSTAAPKLNGEGLTEDQAAEAERLRDAYRKQTEALKGNARERQIAQAGMEAYTAAMERHGNETLAQIEKGLAEAGVRRDLKIAISDENAALDLNIDQTMKVAEAYRISAEAGLKAEAVAQAVAEAHQSGADAADRANRLLRQRATEAFKSAGEDLQRLKSEVANLPDILKGAQQGPASEEAARRRAEADALYRDRIRAAEVVPNNKAMVDQLKAERDETERLFKVRDDYNRKIVSAGQLMRGAEDDLDMLRLEGRLVGKTNEEREREIGLLQLRQQLVAAGYTGDELDAELVKLKAINDERAKQAEVTRKATEQFERNKQAANDAMDIIRDGFEDAVMNGEKFSDVLRNISKAFLQLGMDLVVMQPLRDMVETWMRGGSGGSGMTPGTSSGPGGGGIWGTLASLAQTGLSLWSGNVAGAVAGAASGVTTATSGGFGGAPVIPVQVQQLHSGGIVGSRDGERRVAPSSIFVNAPRFHGGGLVPGERAAILQTGEEVLTARNPRHRRNYGGSGHTVVMNINTPDANSFRQSQGQITAAAARSLQIAARRNG